MRMIVQGVPEHEICDAMDINSDEYLLIVTNPKFGSRLREMREEQQETHLDTNELWNKLERDALKVGIASLGDVDNPKDAIDVALKANKANRRARVNSNSPAANVDSGGVIRTTRHVRTAVFEEMTQREKQISNSAPQHDSDIVGVQQIEEFMQSVETVEITVAEPSDD